MDKTTHQMRHAQWTSIISECNSSGMSKKACIEANNIDEKQFYYWQRRIRQESLQELKPMALSTPSFVELPAPSLDAHMSTHPDAVLNIKGYSLEISNTLSPLLLQTILQVMTNA